MPPVRAVIFDLGHTVWDYAPSEASYRLSIVRMCETLEASHADAPAPRKLERVLSEVSQRWFREWYEDPSRLEQPPSRTIIAQALDEVGTAVAGDVLDELTRTIFGREVDMPVIEPDSIAAIATLHERGVAMGCVTNTILLEGGIADALARLGLYRYFRSVIVSSEVGYRKPHASLFRRAVEELGVEPTEALFVGDRLAEDVGGAKAVGMRAVLTHQYRQETPDGASVKPDAVIQRLGELPATVERIEAQSWPAA